MTRLTMAKDFTRDSMVGGGYDYDFVNPTPDRLLCNICQLPCREPQQTRECGHLFCKSCIKKLMSSTTMGWGRDYMSHACPVCRKEPFTIFPQLKDDREIKALKVYCPNKSDGCIWTGELVSIIGHKLPQKCTPCDKCNDIIHYTNMINHLGTCPCYCPYCGITAEREVISSEHKEKCHKFPLTCPNKCGLDHIPRGDIDEHKKVCPFEVIQCEYQCGAMITRNEMDQHNKKKMTEHMQLTFKETTTTVFNELRNEIKALRNDMPSHKDVCEVHKEVCDLRKEFSEVCKGISGQGPRLEIPRQDNIVVSPIRLYLTAIVLCAAVAILTAVLLQTYFTVTLDLDDTEPELVEKSKRKDEQQIIKLTQTEKLLLSLSESVIYGNESLWPLVLFASSEMLDQVVPVIIRMADFAKLREMEDEDWYSKSFLAFNEGYQMCLRVYPNGFGDGKGTHLSVFLHLMKGKHDDKLEQSGQWPLRGTFIIELLNQLSNKHHHSRKMVFSAHTDDDSTKRVVKGGKATTGWGLHQFISHSTLLHHIDNGYLKNNTLYFRVNFAQ